MSHAWSHARGIPSVMRLTLIDAWPHASLLHGPAGDIAVLGEDEPDAAGDHAERRGRIERLRADLHAEQRRESDGGRDAAAERGLPVGAEVFHASSPWIVRMVSGGRTAR